MVTRRFASCNPTMCISLSSISICRASVGSMSFTTCGRSTLAHIPIIVLTGNELDGLQKSLTAGVTSALKKPLDWQAFGEHVRHVLELAFRAGHLATRDP